MGYINQPRGKGDHPGRIATLARLKEGRDLLKSGAAGAKGTGGGDGNRLQMRKSER